MSRFADLLATPGVEEHLDLAGRFGFMAFHRGLEGGTAELASAGAGASGASLYMVVQPWTLQDHVPSHHVTPSESERLAHFLGYVDVIVSLHGYTRPDPASPLWVGGSNRVLAATLASALRRRLHDFEVVDDLDAIPVSLRGQHRDNPVNLCRRGGVQLEIPRPARLAREATGILDALVEVSRAWGRRAPCVGPEHP